MNGKGEEEHVEWNSRCCLFFPFSSFVFHFFTLLSLNQERRQGKEEVGAV